MKPIIVGNWKANKNFEIFNKISSKFTNIEICIALPYIYIPHTKNYNQEFISIAAQDCSKFPPGSYTGEVPASFLKDNQVKYVIIGHSERRKEFKENSYDFSAKINRALAAGLKVIYCIGENSEERDNQTYLKVLYDQFLTVVGEGIEIDIAYEPVWAIGTGIIPKIEEITEVVEKIKRWSKIINVKGRILYGGSVCYETMGPLQKIPGVDGFLIGKSSLKEEFIDICEAFNASYND